MAPFPEKKCRICEQKKAHLLNDLTKEENLLLITKYLICANVIFSVNDKLPKYFCATCIINLNAAYHFREQCELTQEKLFRSVEKIESQKLITSSVISPARQNSELDSINITETSKRSEGLLINGKNNVEEINVGNLDIKEEITDEHDNTIEQCPFNGQTDNQCIGNIPKFNLQSQPHEETMQTGNDPFICGKSTESVGCKSEHRKTNIIKLFKCGKCTATFASLYSLHLHQINHFKKRPFKCFYCPTSFNSRSGLASHLPSHLPSHKKMHTAVDIQIPTKVTTNTTSSTSSLQSNATTSKSTATTTTIRSPSLSTISPNTVTAALLPKSTPQLLSTAKSVNFLTSLLQSNVILSKTNGDKNFPILFTTTGSTAALPLNSNETVSSTMVTKTISSSSVSANSPKTAATSAPLSLSTSHNSVATPLQSNATVSKTNSDKDYSVLLTTTASTTTSQLSSNTTVSGTISPVTNPSTSVLPISPSTAVTSVPLLQSTSYNFLKISKKRCRIDKSFNVLAEDFKFQFRSMTNYGGEMNDFLCEGIDELLKIIITNYASHFLIKLKISLPSMPEELDFELHFRKIKTLSSKAILELLETGSQSSPLYRDTRLIEISLTIVKTPHSGPMCDSDKLLLKRKKRSIIDTNGYDRDLLSLPKAIVLGKCLADKNYEQMKALSRKRSQLLKQMATKLVYMSKVRVVSGNGCNIEDVLQFQKVLPDYSIDLYTEASGKVPIIQGPVNIKKRISIYLFEKVSYFVVIKKLISFFNQSYQCEVCLRLFKDKAHHKCETRCSILDLRSASSALPLILFPEALG